jgi:hypothetical protein
MRNTIHCNFNDVSNKLTPFTFRAEEEDKQSISKKQAERRALHVG